ncbi:MAG TPA: hypothetical protein VGI86_08540, partial [Acidimicrobiia bacterium]
LDPGELSAAAGFAPVGQAPGVAVAIGADGRLDERDRRMLQLLYREMVRAETVEPRGPAQREVAAKRRPGRSRR